MSRHLLVVGLAGAAVMALGACANLDSRNNDRPISVRFDCDDDRDFLALFSEDRQRSFVKTDDETYELRLVDRDGDEREYANSDGVELTVENDDGHLRIPDGDDYEDCHT